MSLHLLAHLAVLILPAPILAVGTLFVLRRLSWMLALVLTTVLALVATWLHLHMSDVAMGCTGAGCEGHWLLRDYLAYAGTAVLGGWLVAALLLTISRRVRSAPPA